MHFAYRPNRSFCSIWLLPFSLLIAYRPWWLHPSHLGGWWPRPFWSRFRITTTMLWRSQPPNYQVIIAHFVHELHIVLFFLLDHWMDVLLWLVVSADLPQGRVIRFLVLFRVFFHFNEWVEVWYKLDLFTVPIWIVHLEFFIWVLLRVRMVSDSFSLERFIVISTSFISLFNLVPVYCQS